MTFGGNTKRTLSYIATVAGLVAVIYCATELYNTGEAGYRVGIAAGVGLALIGLAGYWANGLPVREGTVE